MASIVDICNFALSEIGEATIVDLNEASTEARACKRHYEQSKNFLLEKANWSFAESVKPLALTTEEPVEWTYAYAYPSDALTIKYTFPKINIANNARHCDSYSNRDYQGIKALARQSPFKIRLGDQDKMILSDTADAYVCYTKNITDTTRFSSQFIDVLTFYLASKMVTSIVSGNHGRQLKADLYNQYQEALLSAMAHDQMQQNQGKHPDSPSIRARHSYVQDY